MKGFLKFIVILLILVVIAAISLSLWLKTDSARDKIEKLVAQVISQQLDMDIKIDGLELSLPLIANAKNITISQKNNDIIIIKNFYINILPSLFSFWEISIWSLNAEELNILHSPSVHNVSESNSAYFFDPNIVIRKLNIEKITLPTSLTGQKEAIILALNSNLKFDSTKQQLNFIVQSRLIALGSNIMDDNIIEILGFYNAQKEQSNIRSLEIKSNLLKARGNFLFDKLADNISGKLKYDTNIIEYVMPKNWGDITSKISGEIIIDGSIDEQHIKTSGNMVVDLPENDYLRFQPVTWDSKLLVSGKDIDGTIKLVQGDVDANGDIGYRNKKLYLKNLRAISTNFEKIVDITFDPSSFIMNGDVSIKDSTLKESAESLLFLNSGAISLKATYSSLDNKAQAMSIKGQIRQLETKFGDSDLIDIDINWSDLWNLQLAKSNLKFKTIHINDFVLNEVIMRAFSDSSKSIQLDGSVIANYPYPIDFSFITRLSGENDQQLNLNITDLHGKMGGVPIHNNTNIFLNYGQDIILKPISLAIGDGTINAKAELKEQNVDASINLSNVPIDMFSVFMPNSFNHAIIAGDIALSGQTVKPILKTDIEIKNIDTGKSTNKLSGKITSEINSDSTAFFGKIFMEQEELVNLSAELSNKFTLIPFQYNIEDHDTIKANLSVIKEFDLLSMIPLPFDNKLSGNIKGEIMAEGTFSATKFSGGLEISDGKYRHKTYGIRIKDINAQITAEDSRILFDKIVANDDFNNPLTAKGVIFTGADKKFKISMNTDKFNLMNTSYLQGEIRGGLVLEGDTDSAVSKGRFVLGPMEIKIPQHFQQEIAELNVSKVIKASSNNILYEQDTPYKLKLDIDLDVMDKIYVRGWGVDTQIQGKLHAGGVASEPLINGTLNSIHGKYQEFGKSLNVEKGMLIFDGPISPSPYLNIVGVSIVGNNEIRLILSGPIQTPDIRIESTPQMSQEQALSMLLFGEDPDNISTFQAIQLADGVRRLSGAGRGFDPLGTGKKILGIDDISLKSDSEDPENISLGVGKHLGDKIYLEIERGRQEGSMKTKIEIQVTPKISIENSVEEEGNTSFGINWRFDY